MLALDRIASLAKKLKDLNAAGVALRAGTQAILSERRKTKEKTMKQRRLINQKRAA